MMEGYSIGVTDTPTPSVGIQPAAQHPEGLALPWQGDCLAGVDERPASRLLDVVDSVHDVALTVDMSDAVEGVTGLDGDCLAGASEVSMSSVRDCECHDEQGTYGHRYKGE